jgi:hypothetical protein
MIVMVNVGSTSIGSGASLALDARVAVGAGVFAAGNVDAAPAVAESGSSGTEQKLPTYNAFEFTYRSDFGKIILLEQNVETGQAITQIPTEYHLQQYAASQRAQRVQQLQQTIQGGGSGSGRFTAGTGTGSGTGTSAKTVTSGGTASTGGSTTYAGATGSAAPAPAAPAAPAVAATSSGGGVNITV